MTATIGSQHDQSLPLGSLSSTTSTRLVRSFNEWDPLEEVIVGSLEGAVMPPSHITVTRTIPPLAAQLYRLFGGHRYPRIMVDAARRELEGFVKLLQAEGITVKRPDTMDFTVRARTPFWNSKGYCVACPRDGFLIVGDEIIETPMAWRSRYFEGHAFRKLFKDYFARGARWTAAPRPELRDELFDYKWTRPHKDEAVRYMITEFEPVFDAADFVRCGRDLFGIRSNVTNAAGFEWLRRHLARDGYRVHELQHQCRTAMHIDSTFVPLCPGKVLVNPEYLDPAKLPAIFKSWDILVAPRPDPAPLSAWRFRVSQCSPWISINVLMLDPKRVVVEASQRTLIAAFRDWGFQPIACPFLNYAPFGGSFHCATLDVRRRGELESYFP
jgi:glycine amidinotransferase